MQKLLKIGFGDQTKSKAVDKAIEKFFTPEFRNRLDTVVQFNKLVTRTDVNNCR